MTEIRFLKHFFSLEEILVPGPGVHGLIASTKQKDALL